MAAVVIFRGGGTSEAAKQLARLAMGKVGRVNPSDRGRGGREGGSRRRGGEGDWSRERE